MGTRQNRLKTSVYRMTSSARRSCVRLCGVFELYGSIISVSCFGVIVSVMFHFMFVHYTFSSVCVAELPPFEK